MKPNYLYKVQSIFLKRTPSKLLFTYLDVYIYRYRYALCSVYFYSIIFRLSILYLVKCSYSDIRNPKFIALYLVSFFFKFIKVYLLIRFQIIIFFFFTFKRVKTFNTKKQYLNKFLF